MTQEAKKIIEKVKADAFNHVEVRVSKSKNLADIPTAHRCWSTQSTQHDSWVYPITAKGEVVEIADPVHGTSNSNAGNLGVSNNGYSIGEIFADYPKVVEVVVVAEYWNLRDSRLSETHIVVYSK